VLAPDQAPYPGLRPFNRDETHLFFGRDECVNDMLVRLAETRFLAVLGSSGTGKSSLVKTGLLPSLEMGLLSGAGSRWRIVDFRPGSGPFAHLARRLIETEAGERAEVAPDSPAVEHLRSRLAHGGPRALIEWCREGHLAEGTNLLLLVDQFEELFRYQDYAGREEAEGFVSLLLESRRPIEVARPEMAEFPIYIAITMRSEYLGACALIEGLAEAINEGAFLTPRMTRQQCEEAIVGPARVCGIEIEDRLVAKILNDLANFAPWEERGEKDQLSRLAQRADQLPLMQHALNQMWQRARSRQLAGQTITLTVDDYHGLEQELDDHAEQVLAALGEDHLATVEIVFRAVTSGTTVANAVRRPTRYGELVELAGGDRRRLAEVIAAFGHAGCNFLTADVRTTGAELPDAAIVDISHESLIRQWRRLSRWLAKEGEQAHDWQRLNDEAKQYWAGDRAHRGALLSGRRLAGALALQRETDPAAAWAGRYDIDLAGVKRFLVKSRNVRAGRRAAAVAIAVTAIALLFHYAPWESERLRSANIHLSEQMEHEKNFHLAVVEQGKAIVNLLSDTIERYRTEKRGMVSAQSAKVGAGARQGASASGSDSERKADHAAQSEREADVAPDESSESKLKDFRERYSQLTGMISAIDNLFAYLIQLESNNVEIIRSHMATLAFLSVLRDDPYGEQALEERQKAYQLADSLAGMDLDVESVRTAYVSLASLSLALEDDGRYSNALEALDKAQAIVASFTGKPGKSPQERDRATNWLADIHLRQCSAYRSLGQLDQAISTCARGLAVLADVQPGSYWETRGGLHQALGNVYAQQAKKIAGGDEALALRKKASTELRASVADAYPEFESRFNEYLEEIQKPAGWRAIIADLPVWSGKNLGNRIGTWLAEEDPAFALTRSGTIAQRLASLAEIYDAMAAVPEARAAFLLEYVYRYELAFRKTIDEKAHHVRAAIEALKSKGDPASLAKAKSEETAASGLIGYDHDFARRRLAGVVLDIAFFEGQPNREQESAEKLFTLCIDLMSRVAEQKTAKAVDQESAGYCYYGLSWLHQLRAETERRADRKAELFRRAREAGVKATDLLEHASAAPDLDRVPHFLNIGVRRLSFILENLNDAAEALAQADRAIRVARIAYARQQSEEAADDLMSSDVRKGDLLKAQGDLDGAIGAYGDYRTILKGLVARDPSRSEWRRDLGVVDDRIGDLLVSRSKLDDALAEYRDANSLFKALVAEQPGNVVWRRDLSINYSVIGDVLKKQGKVDDALAAYRESLAIRKGLLAQDPDNTQFQRDLSLVSDYVGDLLKAKGQLEDALTAYRDGLALDLAVVAKDPGNATWRRDLSISYNLIGGVLRMQGKLDEALAAQRETLAIRKELVAQEPDNTQFQDDLSLVNDEIGDLLKAQGKLDEALAAYRDSLALDQGLVARDPTNAVWRRNLSISYALIGTVLRMQKKPDEALVAFRESRELRKALVAQEPSKLDWQRDLAVLVDTIGDVLKEQEKFDEALAEYRDANSLLKVLVDRDPRNTLWQSDLRINYDRIGEALQKQGKRDEALAAYRKSRDLRKALVAQDPSDLDWQRDLAVADDTIGDVLRAQEKFDAALAEYRDANSLLKALVDRDPQNAGWQRDLSINYRRMGDALQKQGKLDEALAAYRDSFAIRKELLARDPGSTQAQSDLSGSYSSIGLTLRLKGSLREALVAYREALALDRALVARDAKNSDWQADLRADISDLGGLSWHLVLAGDSTAALEAADDAIAVAPDEIWIQTNRAHALMFLGRTDEARAVYLKYRGVQNVQDKKPWETVILADFAELRKQSLSRPLMNEIEKLFSGKA
jgi:tetratricopeptide (TPR) repeat protein